MTQIAPGSSAMDDARLELSIAAMSAERRNRPLWLIWVAGLLLVVAAIYAINGLSVRAEAQRKLDTSRAREATLTKLVGEVTALKSAEATRGFSPDPFVASKLEKAAQQLGLKPLGPISEVDPGPGAGGVPGMARKTYTARFGNEDPVLLLKWLERVRNTPELPGIELSTFKLNTGAATYSAEVQFSRWEKRS